MIIIKNKDQIEGIRRSSKLAASLLNEISSLIKPGIDTESINAFAHNFIIKNKALPAPLNYNGFPKSICTSINDVVCHGIPSRDEILKEGDIIKVDVTTILDGYYGDTCATFPVGKISREAQSLIDVTRQALTKSIQSLSAHKNLNDCVGKIIQPFVEKQGFSVVRDLGGHGVGLRFHEKPFVFHFNCDEGVILKPGMIFTIEPMVNAGDWPIYLDSIDGWTIRTKDKSLSAQFEHTVLITDSGYEVLTSL